MSSQVAWGDLPTGARLFRVAHGVWGAFNMAGLGWIWFLVKVGVARFGDHGLLPLGRLRPPLPDRLAARRDEHRDQDDDDNG